MEDLIVFDIKLTETIDVLCYEGNYMTLYENENELCHFLKIKPADSCIIDTLKNIDILEYVLYINEKTNELEFYNFGNGDSILFNYLELEDINYGHEQIIIAKIKYLIDENNKLSKNLDNIHNKIKNMYNYFSNEFENVNRKISFFEEGNKTKAQYKNIGKKEIIKNIMDKLKELK